jgi:hypothetical protein
VLVHPRLLVIGTVVQNGFPQRGKIVKIALGTVIILWGPPDDLPTPRLSRKKDSVSWEIASSQNVSFIGRKD